MNDLITSSSLQTIKKHGGKLSITKTITITTEVTFPDHCQPTPASNSRPSVGSLERSNPDCFVVDATTNRDKRSDKRLNLPS